MTFALLPATLAPAAPLPVGLALADMPVDTAEPPPDFAALLANARITMSRPEPDNPAYTPDADETPDTDPGLLGLMLVLPAPPDPAPAPEAPPPTDLIGVSTVSGSSGDHAPRSAPPVVDLRTPDWPIELARHLGNELGAPAPGQDQEMTLDLSPETLGPLRLHVTLGEDGARVTLLASTPEAARLIQENRQHLDQALAEAGFSLAGDGAPSQGRPAPSRIPVPTPLTPPASAHAPTRTTDALDLLA